MSGTVIAGLKDRYKQLDVSQTYDGATQLAVQQTLGLREAGGYSLRGHSGYWNGWGCPSTIAVDDFTAIFDVTPRWDAAGDGTAGLPLINLGDVINLSFGNYDQPGGGIHLTVWDQTTVTTWASVSLGPKAQLENKRAIVAFVRKAGVWALFFNGRPVPFSSTPPTNVTDITRMFGGVYGGYGQFCGSVHETWLYSFAMNSDQIRQASGLGRSYRLGAAQNDIAQGGNGWGGCSTFSGTPTSFSVTCLQGVPGTVGWVFDTPVPVGSKIRLRGRVTSIGPGTWGVQGWNVSANSHTSTSGPSVYVSGTGEFDMTFIATDLIKNIAFMNSAYSVPQWLSIEALQVDVMPTPVTDKRIHLRGLSQYQKTIGAPWGTSYLAGTFPGDGLSSPSWSGDTLTITHAEGAVFRLKPFYSAGGYKLPVGTEVKLDITLSRDVLTINPLSTSGGVVWANEGVNTARLAGRHAITYTTVTPIHPSDLCFFIAATAGVASYTLHSVTIEGLQAHWRPDMVLKSRVWVDSTGNSFHLTPQGTEASDGVTALAPVTGVPSIYVGSTDMFEVPGFYGSTNTSMMCRGLLVGQPGVASVPGLSTGLYANGVSAYAPAVASVRITNAGGSPAFTGNHEARIIQTLS